MASISQTGGDVMSSPEISIVMPCLNEEKTIGICIEKAMQALEELGVSGEVVVVDNGSTDRSMEIAKSLGARVLHQPVKGYGSAYLKGLSEARGRYIVMGDSDNQFDFGEIDRLIAPLHDGYDMVMGNRFAGKAVPGAMPWHHRYIGNPVLSGILNLFFNIGIHDAHCGMRAVTREALDRMHLQTTGMEFASEMLINASKAGLRITEVPVTLYPRAEGTEAKLQSFRDGWRHLRFMLMYSPTHLYLWPGSLLMLLGVLILGVLAIGPLSLGSLFFGFHWMFVGSLLTVLGFQIINLGLFARFYSLTSHFDEGRDRIAEWLLEHFDLESGIVLGGSLFGLGILFDLVVLLTWLSGNFQSPVAVRLSIVALTLSILGAQTIFSAFFLSMMTIKRQGEVSEKTHE
jgi:glycosyltransferase involved in cell wall biosynthesis